MFFFFFSREKKKKNQEKEKRAPTDSIRRGVRKKLNLRLPCKFNFTLPFLLNDVKEMSDAQG